MAEKTILDLYRNEVESPRSAHYVHGAPGRRRELSTEEFFRKTSALAEGFAKLGLGRGDRLMLLSDNRPEWHMVDLATLNLGAVDVPVYPTLTADQIRYQALDSGAKLAVVDTREQLEKFLEVRDDLPDLKHLLLVEGEPPPGVLSLDDAVAAGDTGGAGGRFWDRAGELEPDLLATIVYTSGTTGDPKGVMLTHGNFVSNVLAAGPRGPISREDVALEFLPLCHVLERMVGYILMWRATFKVYCSIYDVGEVIAAVRPTIFAAVPRFYEKIHQRITERVAAAPPAKRTLFEWAIRVGRSVALLRLAGKEPGAVLAAEHRLADRLVLSKVREALGGRVRYAISGGAELPLHLAEFFHALGIFVVEGYGLTETSPVIAVNGTRPGEIRLGTVGKPLENLEVRIAADGELLVKGPSVFSGYWNKPEATAEAFDEEGFFHTGDIAELDEDGFLLIVDRKKDLIVTAGGKNVAPQPIESHLAASPLVENAVLVGDGRPYIAALIVPAFEELERRARAEGISWVERGELVAHPRVRQLYAEVVRAVNSGLARYEQIKRFELLPEPLTVESGQLTPTLKVKRRVIAERYQQVIERLYSEPQ